MKDKKYAIFNGHQIEIAPDDIITANGSVFKNENGGTYQTQPVVDDLGRIYVMDQKWIYIIR